MKKLSVLLLLTCSLFSCSEGEGVSPPLTFPRLKVVNSSGVDLLNPNNIESYDTSSIKASFFEVSGEIDAPVKISLSEQNNIEFFLFRPLLTPFESQEDLLGTHTVIVDFSEYERDTLTWVVGEDRGYKYTDRLIYKGEDLEYKGSLDWFYTWVK